MAEKRIIDVKIKGSCLNNSAICGDTYRNVSVKGGTCKLYGGDLFCENLVANTSYFKFSERVFVKNVAEIKGIGRFTKEFNAKVMKLNGSMTFESNLKAEEIYASDLFCSEEIIYADKMVLDNCFFALNNVYTKDFIVSSLYVKWTEEKIKKTKELEQNLKSMFQEEYQKVVAQTPIDKLESKVNSFCDSFNHLLNETTDFTNSSENIEYYKVNYLKCKNVDAVALNCKKLVADNVKLSKNCKVDELIYRLSADIHPEAIIGKITKIGAK